jgi:hypothetical protein
VCYGAVARGKRTATIGACQYQLRDLFDQFKEIVSALLQFPKQVKEDMTGEAARLALVIGASLPLQGRWRGTGTEIGGHVRIISSAASSPYGAGGVESTQKAEYEGLAPR